MHSKVTKSLFATLFGICAVFIFGIVNSAYAADICWDGGGTTTNWSEDANWAGNVEPGVSDVAVFDNGTCSGSPNKNVTLDVIAQSYLGINMVAYTGTISFGSNFIAVQDFTQAAGTIDLDTGAIIISGDFTRTGGNYTADQGITAINLSGGTITGSTTFYDLVLATTNGANTHTIASGTTLTVTGVLQLDGSSDANDALNGPGGISAQGDIDIIGEGIYEGGSAIVTINGTGTQTLDGEADTDTRIPNVTIDKSSGTLNITDTVVVNGDWVYEQGTVSAGSSTIVFLASTSSIDGSHTLANASIVTTTGVGTKDITSGTTLTLTGNLTIDGSSDPNDTLAGPGTIAVQGNVSLIGDGIDGDAIIAVTGTGTQTLDGEADTNTRIPAFTINKSNGTLNITDTIVATNDWTYSQGTVSPGSSHVIFSVGEGTITGSHTLNDITFRSENGSRTRDIASGTTLTASDDVVIDGTTDNNDTLNGPGTIAIQGDLTIVTDGIGGTPAITFTGTNSQIITTAGTTLPSGTWTINKSSGTVTLASALTLDGTGQDLVISSGTLDMSTFALTVDDVVTINGGLRQGTGNFIASNGNVTIGTTGWWLNNSTGDIDAEGGDTITNNGYIRWDGTSAGCGGADGISLTRNGSGAVNLAGSGRWRVYDITIGTTGIYAASPALTIYSSSITGSQTGITNNASCPSERTWIGSGNYNTAANWSGTAVPGSTELAIFDATSTSNMTVDADPNDNGFQINLGYSGTITQTNGVDITLDDQGWEQNAGTFTGGDATSDILLANNGNFVLNTGTFTTPGGTFEFYGNFTVAGGTLTASSGTLKTHLEGADSQTFTGSFTANNLNIYGDICCNPSEVIVASGTTITVNGTLTFDDNASDQRNYLQGPGAIHAKGPVTVLNNGFVDEYSTNNSSVVINGTGNQTITGISGAGNASLPNLTINKTSGNITFVDRVGIFGNFTFTNADNVISTGSTVEFWGEDAETYTLTGSITLNNVTFHYDECCNGAVHTIASGTTITANGNLLIEQTGSRTDSRVNGPGGLDVKGNVTVSGDICQDGCTATLTMSGSSDANLINGSTTGFLDGTITINKSSGTVTLGSALTLDGSGQDLTITDGTLANSTYALTVNDAFTINDTFSQGAGNVSATSYTVTGSGIWTNTSTGDVTVGTGGVSNSGDITLGDVNTCGGANNIAITSSSGGQQRSWSGSGDTVIYDATVQDQGGSASITAYSSQNVSGNGGNWTFNNTCPAANQDIRIRGGNLRLRGGTKVL